MLIKKYLLLYCVILLIILIRCNNKQKNQEKVNNSVSSIQKQKKVYNNVVKDFNKIKASNDYSNELDSLLDCSEYVYFNYFFRMPDHGCVFNPDLVEDNELGWADVILFLRENCYIYWRNIYF